MAYVVSEACIGCKYTDCVAVCPVDCFYEGPNFLAIDPVDCIDCALCVIECPVDAIYHDHELPPDQAHMAALNAELVLLPSWKPLTHRKPAPPDAEAWKDRSDKLPHLQR